MLSWSKEQKLRAMAALEDAAGVLRGLAATREKVQV
jgi:hypothetical protein